MNWAGKSVNNDFHWNTGQPSIFRKSRSHAAQQNGLSISATASALRDKREYAGTMQGLSKKADKRLAK